MKEMIREQGKKILRTEMMTSEQAKKTEGKQWQVTSKEEHPKRRKQGSKEGREDIKKEGKQWQVDKEKGHQEGGQKGNKKEAKESKRKGERKEGDDKETRGGGGNMKRCTRTCFHVAGAVSACWRRRTSPHSCCHFCCNSLQWDDRSPMRKGIELDLQPLSPLCHLFATFSCPFHFSHFVSSLFSSFDFSPLAMLTCDLFPSLLVCFLPFHVHFPCSFPCPLSSSFSTLTHHRVCSYHLHITHKQSNAQVKKKNTPTCEWISSSMLVVLND